MKHFLRALAMFSLALPAVLPAQEQPATPSVSTIFAVFAKDLDCRQSKSSDPVALRTIRDLVVAGKSVPKGAAIAGHLVEAPSDHALAIVLEQIVLKDGTSIPIHGIISAMAPPAKSLSDDPTHAMMHSMEPKATDASSGMATTGSATATAVLKGGSDPSWQLSENSQGTGDLGLSLRWELAKPPAITILESKKKPFRLKSGTQAVIRMAIPKA